METGRMKNEKTLKAKPAFLKMDGTSALTCVLSPGERISPVALLDNLIDCPDSPDVRLSEKSGNDAPSPWGEGRDEGGQKPNIIWGVQKNTSSGAAAGVFRRLAAFFGQKRPKTEAELIISVTNLTKSVTNRRRSATDLCLLATKERRSATKERLSATKERLSVTKERLSVTEERLSVAKERLSVANKHWFETDLGLFAAKECLSMTDFVREMVKNRQLRLDLSAMRVGLAYTGHFLPS